MRMRLLLVLVGLLVAGAVVAGCGEDENDTQGAGTPTTETGGGGSADPTTTEEGGGSGAQPSEQQVEEAVAACKRQIDTQSGVSADVKADLEQICENAASGDEQAVRDATKEVCTKLIEENVPDGPAREQALSACDEAGQTP